VRISAYLKTKDVRALRRPAVGGDGRGDAAALDRRHRHAGGARDDEGLGPLLQRRRRPPDAVQIQFAGAIWGPGTVWMDGFEIADVPLTVPTTNDGKWQAFTPFMDRYSASPDAAVIRNGHATICLHSDGDVPKLAVRRVHASRPSAGARTVRRRKMRIGAFIKAENVTTFAGIYSTVYRTNEMVARYGNRETPPVKGTLGWMRYSAEVNVPAGADSLELGVILHGAGKVWIDDVTMQPVDPAPATAAAKHKKS
jgi:hypothetical protein